MKTAIKTLTCTIALSIVFSACDDTGVNNPEQDLISSSSSKDNCEVYEYLDGSGMCISEKGPEDLPPYDPENIPCTIGESEREWMEEQLTYGKNDRRQFRVTDLLSPWCEDWPRPVRCEEGICYVIDREVDAEEYNKIMGNYEKERAEKRRVSPMIGVFVMDLCSLVGDAWLVLMTAEEIVELTEKYKGLMIDIPMPQGY